MSDIVGFAISALKRHPDSDRRQQQRMLTLFGQTLQYFSLAVLLFHRVPEEYRSMGGMIAQSFLQHRSNVEILTRYKLCCQLFPAMLRNACQLIQTWPVGCILDPPVVHECMGVRAVAPNSWLFGNPLVNRLLTMPQCPMTRLVERVLDLSQGERRLRLARAILEHQPIRVERFKP
jgi:hypothetical protein